jgi:hypothetical protein
VIAAGMQALRRNFASFRQLPRAGRHDAVAALWLAMWYSLRLRVLGLPAMRAASPDPVPQAPAALALEDIRSLARLVDAVVHRALGTDQCLARSLVLQSMLRRKGVDSRLRIGVQRAGTSLRAHAWVECGGIPVNDTPLVTDQYAALDGLVLAKGLDIR